MDTAHPLKFCFILDRNLAKANCTGNHVCTSCDKVVLGYSLKNGSYIAYRLKDAALIGNIFDVPFTFKNQILVICKV